nr:helix-turn-helix transcriptional regulator [uncultured Ruminococcus sp.]
MDENYIRRRITELRIQKNVSEYKMSMDLGHSKGYIQSISSGRALPSMSEFLAICDYFDIAPLDFFNDEGKNILIQKELDKEISAMSESDLKLMTELARRLNNKNN